MWKKTGAILAGGIGGVLIFASLASALNINGYTPARHNRFSSGYPSAPIANTDPTFIGLGYDWSGVGWNAADPNQSFALLGPRFFLYARHYSPGVGATLQFTPSDGEINSYTVQALSGALISGSDLAVGKFTAPIPETDNIHPYSILFLGYDTSITSPYHASNYTNLLLYGWTARIGWNQLTNILPPNYFSGDQGYYFDYPFDTTTPDRAKLVGGDSGSPTFIVTGTPGEMYLAGDHYAVYQDGTGGIDSFLALELPQISGYMAQWGYLPYVVTPVTAIWTSSGSSSWGIGSNWSPTGVPADVLTEGKVTTTASVLFDGSATLQRNINLGANRTVTSITFANAPGANAFTIVAGNTLTLGEAGLTNNDDDVQTLACSITLRSSQRWDVGQGGLAVSGSINTGTNNLLLIEGDGNTTLSGVISATGGALSKDGLGVLTLSSAAGNSYTGRTFINGGTIAITRDNHLGAAPGSFVANQLTINGGTLQAKETFTVSGNRGIALDSLGGSISVDSGKTLTAGSVISTIAGASSSPFTKSGNGILILNAANTYSGLTTVSGGTLQVGSGGTTGALGLGSVTNNAILSFNRSNSLLISNNIDGTGSLQKLGAGTLTLTGTNSYAGTTTISNGALQVGSGGTTGTLGTGSVVDNTLLSFNRSDGLTVSNNISGPGSLQNTGTGTLTLSGTNSYAGTTTVTSGVLQLANVSALGTTTGNTIVQSGGTLDLNGLTIGNEALIINGNGSNGNGALVNNNASVTAIYNGAVTLGSNTSQDGSGNMTLNGTFNLGNYIFTKKGPGTLNLTYSENWGNNSVTIVQAGTLSYQQGASATTTVAPNIPLLQIDAGATVNVNANYNDPFTDAVTPTQHVQIVNNSMGGFNLTAGTSSVAGISGTGYTSVTGGSTLNSDYIYQNQLSVSPGSKVTLGAPSASSTPSVTFNSDAGATPLSTLDSTTADLLPVPVSATNALSMPSTTYSLNTPPIVSSRAITMVPEPSTWLMLILASAIGLLRFVWKRKSQH